MRRVGLKKKCDGKRGPGPHTHYRKWDCGNCRYRFSGVQNMRIPKRAGRRSYLVGSTLKSRCGTHSSDSRRFLWRRNRVWAAKKKICKYAFFPPTITSSGLQRYPLACSLVSQLLSLLFTCMFFSIIILLFCLLYFSSPCIRYLFIVHVMRK